MPRGNDAAIGTLTEFLDELVLGVDDEGRVERAETVSLHDRGRQGSRNEMRGPGL